MPVMVWKDCLVLDQGVMDDTHREFIALMNWIADASDEDMVMALDVFIAHTEAHFAQERRWMEQLAYESTSCHVREHDAVLETAREVRRRAAAGETGFGRVLARAVAEWFVNHAATRDAALAQHMKEAGFTPEPAAVS